VALSGGEGLKLVLGFFVDEDNLLSNTDKLLNFLVFLKICFIFTSYNEYYLYSISCSKV